MNPMILSSPWDDSLDITAMQSVKKMLGINPMRLSAPREDSLGNVSLNTTAKIARY